MQEEMNRPSLGMWMVFATWVGVIAGLIDPRLQMPVGLFAMCAGSASAFIIGTWLFRRVRALRG